MRILIACFAAAAFLACGDDTPSDEESEIYDMEAPPAEVAPDTAAATTYAPELDVDLGTFTRTSSGLYWKDLAAGSGAAIAPGQTAVVHYIGWLPDGTMFQSSREMGDPVAVPVGVAQVIPGWDEGVAGMQAGGRRKLVIPPGLGYGAQGSGGLIPPNATLIFEIELLEIR